MRLTQKRGLSPVVASVLLIGVALVLATIIFLWARNVVKEKETKFGEPVEKSCENIDFSAEVRLSGADVTVSINNKGNVAIYGIEIRREIGGSVEKIGRGTSDDGITVGGSGSMDVELDEVELEKNEKVIVVPIILGETEQYKKPYTCSEEFGYITNVVGP